MPATKERIRIGTEEATILLSSEETGGFALAFEVTMPPGGGPPVPHRHQPTELYRIESGELALYIEADDGSLERISAKTGELVHIPGSRLHTIRNESPAPARALAIFIPGGEMESFFREVGALSGGETDPTEVVRIAERHGITFEGGR